jgi:hypothetical protein
VGRVAVEPFDGAVAVADRVADVQRGQTVLPAGLRAALEVDRGDHQQQDLEQWFAQQQRRAGARHPQQVPDGEAGGQQHPEADLADHDQRDDHDSSPFVRFKPVGRRSPVRRRG